MLDALKGYVSATLHTYCCAVSASGFRSAFTITQKEEVHIARIVQTHAGTDSTAPGIKVGLKRAESGTHLECTLMAKMCILEHSMTQNSVSPY